MGDGTGVDDNDLVTRARHGDREAFEALVAANAAAARRAAVQFGAGEDADDVVQEAFVKAYRRLAEYRGDAPFRSWLVAIVANETRNLHRSRRRRDAAGQRAALHAAVPAAADEALASTLAAEDRRDLVAAVQGLDDGDRQVIAYRYLLDRSEAETADLLDWPRGTVKSRTARALAKLRTRLGAAISVAVVAALIVAVPPARRAAADVISTVLRFAGVEVHRGAAAPPTSSPLPLPSTRPGTLAEARRLAHFPVGVPAELGEPDRVLLADPEPDGAPRVVSLLYRGGSVRVDEFDGDFDVAFTKTAPGVQWSTVRGTTAIWIPAPHDVTYVGRDGVARPATTRLAGPVLLWQLGDVAYRIEGLSTAAEAVSVAASVR